MILCDTKALSYFGNGDDLPYTNDIKRGAFLNSKQKYKILLVDDEKVNLSVLIKILSTDFELAIAKSGEEALDYVFNKIAPLPDLIFLDVVMPGISGFEVLIKLKEHPETKDIPVIILTALSSDLEEEKGLSLGAADYVTKPFSPAVIRERVKNQCNIIYFMREAERLSMTDQLTGIPNRRYFDKCFEVEWARAVREKTPLTFFILDIDLFKVYNDTYGHPAGDILLKKVSEIIGKDIKRATDFYARLGGEEFGVILPNITRENAYNVAEKLRISVSEIRIPAINIITKEVEETKVTISIGLSTIIPSEKSKPETLIVTADHNLYKAKMSGRNKVVCEEQEEDMTLNV